MEQKSEVELLKYVHIQNYNIDTKQTQRPVLLKKMHLNMKEKR